MKIKELISYLQNLPAGILFKKAFNYLFKKNYDKTLKYYKVERRNETVHISQLSLFKIPTRNITPFPSFQHFDLLGSGWIKNNYSSKPIGLERYRYHSNLSIPSFDKDGNWLSQVVLASHLDFSKSCWKLIQRLNSDYNPIDWQKDFKSGFRWSSKHWFRAQRKLMAGKKGVDLKVPWELSRLQHLPQIAIFAKQKLQPQRQEIIADFLCQCLDFIMANPIGMGVNFNCPMDIGIRNANLLLALDFFKQIDDKKFIDHEIEQIITNYVAQSTIHILSDIEYREGLTSNHYLGNVLGILYAGAYLTHPKSTQWLAFGIQELERSMARQFFDDGTNFEGSTSYHRLSGEMMAWAAIITLSIPSDRLSRLFDLDIKSWKYRPKIKKASIDKLRANQYVYSDSFWSKLTRSKFFTETITKNNGNIFQFGDNDSGRFIKFTNIGDELTKSQAFSKYLNLNPDYLSGDEPYWDENSLDHSAFTACISGLMQHDLHSTNNCNLEYQIFKSISSNVSGFKSYLQKIYKPVTTLEVDGELETFPYFKERTFDFKVHNVDFTNDTTFTYFEDFQLVVLRNKDFNLALAGISNPKQHHSLGHTHNDKLAVELQVNGEDILFNPGTYVYTPNPKARYAFRSVKSHNTISVNGQEQNRPLSGGFGLFNLKNETKFKLIKLTETEIIAEVRYRKVIHQRRIKINPKFILVQDWCNHKFEQHWNTGKPYSNGYGKRLA